MTYDAATHSVIVNLGYFFGWQSRTKFVLKYQNIIPGEEVVGGDIVYSGLEGNKFPREFSYPGIKATIPNTTLRLGLIMYPSQTSVGGYYVPGATDTNFYHLSITNN